MVYESNFEDELEFDEVPVSEETIEFDGLQKATAKAERRRKRRRLHNERTGKIVAAVLCFLLILAIVLALVFEKEIEQVLYQDSRDSPTVAPTMSPTTLKPTHRSWSTPSPTVEVKPTYHVYTPSPTVYNPPQPTTISPRPTAVMTDVYRFEPVGDTYLNLDGIHKGRIYGREETLKVQRGNKASTPPGQQVTLPSIVSLLQFDMNQGLEERLPKRSRWPQGKDQLKIELKLQHIPKDSPSNNNDEEDVEDILPVNVEIYRLPNNPEMVVESMTGEAFGNLPRIMTEGILIAQESVNPTDTILNIDVTSAMFLPESSKGYGDEEILLMLKVYWEDQDTARDLFSSREADDKAPLLVFSNMLSK